MKTVALLLSLLAFSAGAFSSPTLDPAPGTFIGQRTEIRNATGNTVTVSGTTLISLAAPVNLATGDKLQLVWDGSHWVAPTSAGGSSSDAGINDLTGSSNVTVTCDGGHGCDVSVAFANGLAVSKGLKADGGAQIVGGVVVTGAVTSDTVFSGTVVSDLQFLSTIDQGVGLKDHSGAGYWRLSTLASTTVGNNLDDLNLTRSGSATPYFRWSLADGTAISRYGFLIGVPGDELRTPVVHGTATNPQAIEAAAAAMTTGSKAVTFSTAFSAAPVCTCSHVDTTNTNGCTIHVAPSTSGVTFTVASGGSDVIDYICIGDR